MSLQICPYCKHNNSYWRIYSDLNLKHFKYGMKIRCENCASKMILKRKYTLLQRVGGGIIWMSPAIILIVLVALGKLNFLLAIGLITLFHFLAFYGIIKLYHYTLVESKK